MLIGGGYDEDDIMIITICIMIGNDDGVITMMLR
jgi:hypothetical protein